jgi:AAA domain
MTIAANQKTLLEPDRDQIEQFVDAVFRHCWSSDGFISLRGFTHDNKPTLIEGVPVTAGFKFLCDAVEDKARRAANEVKKVVFCPPLVLLNNKDRAREQDLLAGPVLSVECDKHPEEARRRLEQVLGPATLVVQSGGEWQSPDGELQKKLHLHWRLAALALGDNLAKLKLAREIAAHLVGGDTSNVPLVHPLRWPGSWHRKGDPVLCSITAIDPDIEIGLDDALAKLKAAAPEQKQKANGHDHSNGYDHSHDRKGRLDWAAMVRNIIGGEDWHESTLRLAASYIATGMSHDQVLRQLQALMLASHVPHDERWKSRFDDLNRLIREGVEKFGDNDSADPKQESQGPGIDLAAVFSFVGDAPAAPPRELIKGLIPAEGVIVTGGQSGGGKTFIQLHKAICLATMTPYFGRKVVERVGTVLVAAEGRPLLPNRFAAGLAKLSITDRLPISWLKQLPDFSSSEGIKLLVAQLKAMDERFRGDFGVRLGNTVIDTVAACFGMKDEDDNAEATKVCNVMRRVGEEVGCAISPVHHYGKNPESGLRGASAWKGSADLIEGVLADIDPLSGRVSNRELVCVKARDGEQGPISAFDLEFIELGLDPDGVIYGSCCVVPTERESRFGKAKPPSKGQKAILDAINEAMDTCGQTIVPRTGMPQVRAVKVADVRKEFDRRYVAPDADPVKATNAKRMAFKRGLDHLSPALFGAGSYDGADWIWKIT